MTSFKDINYPNNHCLNLQIHKEWMFFMWVENRVSLEVQITTFKLRAVTSHDLHLKKTTVHHHRVCLSQCITKAYNQGPSFSLWEIRFFNMQYYWICKSHSKKNLIANSWILLSLPSSWKCACIVHVVLGHVVLQGDTYLTPVPIRIGTWKFFPTNFV